MKKTASCHPLFLCLLKKNHLVIICTSFVSWNIHGYLTSDWHAGRKEVYCVWPVVVSQNMNRLSTMTHCLEPFKAFRPMNRCWGVHIPRAHEGDEKGYEEDGRKEREEEEEGSRRSTLEAEAWSLLAGGRLFSYMGRDVHTEELEQEMETFSFSYIFWMAIWVPSD